MLPGLLMVLHRFYDFTVELLENSNLTFQFKGPWLAGPDFKEVSDVYKDVIFNVESEPWEHFRKTAQVILNHQGFLRLSVSATRSKLKNGLVPLFDHSAKEGMILNLQDVFQRFTFDISMVVIDGSDPTSLSIEMPENEFAKALTVAGEGTMYRHIKPRFLWKLQRWMGLGIEKKMVEASAVFDRVCAEYISTKREEVRLQGTKGEWEDVLTSYIKLETTKYEILNPSDHDRFLKDVILTYISDGRDTITSALTWFLWLLSENPDVVAKITSPKLARRSDLLIPMSSTSWCTYMARYELPSGHKVDTNSKIIIFLYALGRMKAVWGEDASEFKPERWVSTTGSLRHEPTFKFLVFDTGPRSCLGKQLTMNLMKTVIVEILQNYDIHLIEGQKIEPLLGIILRMKHGLSVTITKRDSA
ncbi:hypothetical protein Bca4012_013889 [Brassica carinata]